MSDLEIVLERATNRIKNFSRNTQKSLNRLTTKALIKTRIKLLAEYWTEYKITYADYADAKPNSKEEEFDEIEAEFVLAMGELEGMLETENVQTTNNASSQIGVRTEGIRMKPIEVPHFSGEIEDWVSYRDLFQSIIVKNDSLSDVHRLQHLKTSCKGKALDLIKHIQVTEVNFKVAWDELTKRYENNRLLVSRMLEKFLNLPNMTRECPIELTKLLDGTNQVIRSLTALKRPTEHWDDWLVVQTTRRLDYTTRLAWEKSIGATTEMPTFSELQTYLEGVLRSFEAVKNCMPRTNVPAVNRRSVQSHVVGFRQECFMCRGTHGLYKCPQFLDKTVAQRRQFIERNGVCFTCISSNRHVSRECTSTFRCVECNGRHHTLLHPNSELPEATTTKRLNPFAKRSTEELAERTINTNVCKYANKNNIGQTVLLPTAWVKVRSGGGQATRMRALIDQGSQATFVTEDAVQRLGASKKSTNIVVLGVGEASPGKTYGCINVVLSSMLEKSRKIEVSALVLPRITSDLPGQVVKSERWIHIDTLPLADPSFGIPSQIDMLLGADIFSELLMDGVRHGRCGDPVAQQTIFGWVLSGRAINQPTTTNSVTAMHINLDDMLQRFWVEEEVPRCPKFSAEDEECEAMFARTTKRENDGRYTVELPFRNGSRKLGESRVGALRRLLQVEKRLNTNPEMAIEYEKFIQTYLQLGHMERIPTEEIDNAPQCYLPHHAVLKPTSTTTKLRVVFDATVATTNGKGLNELLLTGPRLQDSLTSILMRWRIHKIAITADIEKMYRQVWVAKKHCDYQRILWREKKSGLIEHYRLKTITYGTSSAPYMAVKTLQTLAKDEAVHFPKAARIVLNDFYVDDCLSGANTLEDAVAIKNELLQLMTAGGFRLMKWSSNNESFLKSLPVDHRDCKLPFEINKDESIKALGIQWHPVSDELGYTVQTFIDESARTKRQVLSEIAKLFDPLGLLALTIVTAKILMQELWLTGLGWDEDLPKDVLDKWIRYRKEMMALGEVRVNRWIGLGEASNSLQLHGFSDASKSAYAACVYARVVKENGEIQVTLLAAKTKVAPIKQQSIPRLELNGAVLLSHLLSECKKSLKIDTEVYAWTDSMVVLAWLRRHANVWPTYIANRVSEIQSTMDGTKWQHVPGSDNPADVASRGVMPAEVHGQSLWWTGPSWLKLKCDSWPKTKELLVEDAQLEEQKQTKCQLAHVKPKFQLTERYSSWTRLTRVTAYCRRVRKIHRRTDSELQADEIEGAKRLWIRLAQRETFNEVMRNIKDIAAQKKLSILKLNPFLDNDGLLRVGGRLQNSNVSFDVRHPFILPKNHVITNLIIRDAHESVMHGGPQSTICQLHQRFWILGEKGLVKQYIRNCITCFKARPREQRQIMGNLPEARVNKNRPFLHTAVDYAGPIQTRTSKGRGHKSTKSWIAVFVCLSTKATHLDLVSDLTTAAFIATFRRFTARRGICSDVYSDNGTNFVGADREMHRQWRKCMEDKELKRHLANSGTQFHFSPPGSPHFNGLAEAAVKMAKTAMRKIIGEHTLTFEEMVTFLSQVEAALNSRPLCAIPGEDVDASALTPGHFLIGQPMTAVPEPNLLSQTTDTDRWRLVQRLTQHFWKRWSKEYLHHLQQRTKWEKPHTNIAVGDIVIVRDDLLPPTKWSLGRVIATHPGTDGEVRVASVKTKNTTIKRSIVKLCRLPTPHDKH